MVAQLDGVGPRTVNELIKVAVSVKELFDHPEKIRHLDVKGIGKKRADRLEESLRKWNLESAREKLKKHGIGVLSQADDEYPDPLKEIYDPPPALFYRGSPEILSGTAVAIVGTRSCNEQGKEIATTIARGLAELDIAVVSGLASGIDASAHRGALNGDGPTVGVLGTGVDRIYPQRHSDLQPEVSREGLIVSEYPPGAGPDRQHFPERNRIISGLSEATVVVQAGTRSGALITADFALEQGREVYAVPGNVSSEKHSGCHMLIKQGAGLVESAEDIIDYLQIEGVFTPPGRSVSLGSKQVELFETIHHQPISIDDMVNQTGFTTGEISEILLELEDHSLVVRLPGQRYQRSYDAKHIEVSAEESI